MAKRRPAPRHWYRIFRGECPVCGRDKSYRVRVYGRPPRDRRKSYGHLPDMACYDWCDV
jgi:hypothetical protein